VGKRIVLHKGASIGTRQRSGKHGPTSFAIPAKAKAGIHPDAITRN
jgi:hypothetical protein